MKTIFKVLIFYVIIVVMLVGCSQDVTTVTNAKLLVGGDFTSEYCLININEDGTVEYISFEPNYADLYGDDFAKEIYKEKTISLSKKNKDIINEFIQGIVENEPREEWLASDNFIIVVAFIGDEIYYSTLEHCGPSDVRYYDENLNNLCYKLVELAPSNVGGKYNAVEMLKSLKD